MSDILRREIMLSRKSARVLATSVSNETRQEAIGTTMRYYTDLRPLDAASAMSRIEAPTTSPTTSGTKARKRVRRAAKRRETRATG